MKNGLNGSGCFRDGLGCFGNFDIQDAVCKCRCALRLRCCIEREKNDRMEILEELVSFEEMIGKSH